MNIAGMGDKIVEYLDRILLDAFGVKDAGLTLTDPPENIDAEYAVACFPAAKAARTSPMKIAQRIAELFPKVEWIESAQAAGPYLNIKLNPAALFMAGVNEALSAGGQYGHRTAETPRNVLVEYSSPNTNKPLHLGHIRNNVLGMAVIRLLKSQGHHVIPATILNDRGIHICKAMLAYMKSENGKTPEDEGIKGDHFVGRSYVNYARMESQNPAVLEEARELLRQWEAGEPSVRKLWERMNQWVVSGFEETYRRLGSEFQVVQKESETYTLGRSIVMTGLEKGVFYREADDSIWMDLTDIGLDKKAIMRSDGTSLYVTQDLGVAVERAEKYNLDQVIYVVGSEQNYHFNMLFEVLKRLGFSWSQYCRHLSYGMVNLPDGKMKSREGTVVDADDLMDEMKNLALQIMTESAIATDRPDREAIGEAIGVGAIKYYILKVGPTKDIRFDPKASLSFEGATGAYLQYTHARIRSILRKAGEAGILPEVLDLDRTTAALLNEREELTLVRTLMRYPGILSSSANDLNPARLAAFLWEVAKAYNGFYHHHRVLDAPSQDLAQARLALCAAAAFCLASGLDILGIAPLDQM